MALTCAAMWADSANGAFPGPNGRLAYESTRDGDSEIFSVNPDGSGEVQLTSNTATDNQPGWSPDGSRIAFASNRDGDFEIYRIDPDGANPTNLTEDPATDLSPAWSPDGSSLAFASDRESGVHIWKMAADGSGPTQVTAGTDFQRDDGPAWSP